MKTTLTLSGLTGTAARGEPGMDDRCQAQGQARNGGYRAGSHAGGDPWQRLRNGRTGACGGGQRHTA